MKIKIVLLHPLLDLRVIDISDPFTGERITTGNLIYYTVLEGSSTNFCNVSKRFYSNMVFHHIC